MRTMGQPFPAGKNGISLWDVDDIERRQQKERDAFERLMQQDSDSWVAKHLADAETTSKDSKDPSTALHELADEFDAEFGTGTELTQVTVP